MKAVREREDAYLEEKVKDGDRDPNKLNNQPKKDTLFEKAHKDYRLSQTQLRQAQKDPMKATEQPQWKEASGDKLRIPSIGTTG